MEVQNIELHRVVATAIIHKEGRFLIVKRSMNKKVWPGRWTVPGGGLETTDYTNTPPTTSSGIWYNTLANTLKREVGEETGLKIGEIRYLLDLAFIRPDRVPVLTLSFYAPWRSGEVRLDDENTEFAWVALAEVPGYDLIEGIPEEIRLVDEILKKKN